MVVNNKFSCPLIVFDKCFINDSVNFFKGLLRQQISLPGGQWKMIALS